MKGQSLSFSDTNSGWWAFPLKFALKVTHHPFRKTPTSTDFRYNVSTVSDSEKSSIMTNRKSTTGWLFNEL